MKKTQSITSKRRERILGHLSTHEVISTNKLAEKLDISIVTLRRDLQTLNDEGLIIRYYGGAKLTPMASNINNTEVSDINSTHNKRKHAIAKHAADLIKDGDTIFINSSSTALLILEYLNDKRVYVITNNGKALQSTIGPNIELVLTGGQVYERKLSLIDEYATYILSKITADKCFLGVSGIDSDSGISTLYLQETLVNHEMINRCGGPVYVLADSSKIGKRNNFSSGEINEISCLITDSAIKARYIKDFEERGLTVMAVEA